MKHARIALLLLVPALFCGAADARADSLSDIWHRANAEYFRGDYNGAAHDYRRLMQAGVIDPTKVARTALQNAASIASLLLTTEAIVVEKKEEKPAPAGPPGGGMGGMY